MRFTVQMSSWKACTGTFCITYPAPCFLKQATLSNCQHNHLKDMHPFQCIAVAKIQEELSTMAHLKRFLPFLTFFLLGPETYYMNNSSPTTESLKIEKKKKNPTSNLGWFSAVAADGTTISLAAFALCVQAVISTSI